MTPPDDELGARIAQEILGWRPGRTLWFREPHLGLIGQTMSYSHWRPETQMQQAWKLATRYLGPIWSLERNGDAWRVIQTIEAQGRIVLANAGAGPRALCLAILRAKELGTLSVAPGPKS